MDNELNITSAQYLPNVLGDGNGDTIEIVVNGQSMFVPLDPNNVHYAEILRQVKEGTLTIKDAE